MIIAMTLIVIFGAAFGLVGMLLGLLDEKGWLLLCGFITFVTALTVFWWLPWLLE